MSKSLDGKVGKDLYDYEVGKDLTRKKNEFVNLTPLILRTSIQQNTLKIGVGRESIRTNI